MKPSESVLYKSGENRRLASVLFRIQSNFCGRPTAHVLRCVRTFASFIKFALQRKNVLLFHGTERLFGTPCRLRGPSCGSFPWYAVERRNIRSHNGSPAGKIRAQTPAGSQIHFAARKHNPHYLAVQGFITEKTRVTIDTRDGFSHLGFSNNQRIDLFVW